MYGRELGGGGRLFEYVEIFEIVFYYFCEEEVLELNVELMFVN